MQIEIKNMNFQQPQEEYQVRVDRTYSVLANPFIMEDESQRDEVCDKYAKYFVQQLNANPEFVQELERILQIAKRYGKLELFCWCAPKRCHSETIREYLLHKLSNN